jgi:hypothetical protein
MDSLIDLQKNPGVGPKFVGHKELSWRNFARLPEHVRALEKLALYGGACSGS